MSQNRKGLAGGSWYTIRSSLMIARPRFDEQGFRHTFYGFRGVVADKPTIEQGRSRELRGGSWYSNFPVNHSCATLNLVTLNYHYSFDGFRGVLAGVTQ